MTQDTREQVKRQYSKSGREYDQIRLEDPRGRLLSDHDVRIFLELLPPMQSTWQVLEVGAGTGRFTIPAIQRGYRLTASDINETMLNELRMKLDDAGLGSECDVRVEDVFQLSFPDSSFDFVFSFHVIPRFNTLDDQRAAILEIARTIKPGGRFLFNYRNRRSLLYGRIHRGFATTPAQMEGILRDAGLRVVRQRGKWLLNRGVLNRLPLFAGRCVARFDRLLLGFRPERAWDVFVEVVKESEAKQET